MAGDEFTSIRRQQQRIHENKVWAKRAGAQCQAILCNSEWTRRQLAKQGFERLQVIRGGVDTNRFQPESKHYARVQLGWDLDSTIAFIAARHVLKKGIDVAIEAISMIDNPHLRLVIAGHGPQTKQLRSLCYSYGVSDRVRFVGPVAHDQLPLYLSASDIGLMPSRNIYDPLKYGIDYETMGRFACEASSCGIPVIASNCGGIPEVVKDDETGILVRPNDPFALADAINLLLKHPEYARRLGQTGLLLARAEFSFEDINQKILEIIQNVP